MNNKLTNAEYAILGLLVERPLHGYDLERLIEERGMREWTELAFSSIYYLLKKLENRKLIQRQKGSASKTRKTFAPTEEGRKIHRNHTEHMICEPGPSYPSILLGMANWPALDPETALHAMSERRNKLAALLEEIVKKQGPGPVFVEVMFDYSIAQIKSEIGWIEKSMVKLGGTDEN